MTVLNNFWQILNESAFFILEDITNFYFSDFYEQRFKRRLCEENILYNPIQFDILLGTIDSLKDDILFNTFTKSTNYKGSSQYLTISLNDNISKRQNNISHIENVIMHEFGHIQYNQPEFNVIKKLNVQIIKSPSPQRVESILDYKYFSNHNELRQRIIPIIKEMYDQKLSSEDVYECSDNLKQDAIYKMYSKEQIIYWLDNIL